MFINWWKYCGLSIEWNTIKLYKKEYKKEWLTDTCHSVDEPLKYYVKALGKKPDSEGYLLHGLLEKAEL